MLAAPKRPPKPSQILGLADAPATHNFRAPRRGAPRNSTHHRPAHSAGAPLSLDARRPLMTIMSDRWITRMAREQGMIEPFEDRQVRKGVISYGVSSYGYDMRVAREFRIFTNVLNSIVDPKQFDPKSFVEYEGDVCIVPPNSFALARSVEYFRIPRNILTVTVGKSTYARCGIITNVTPFEPEWEGFVTLEISNTTPLPAKIYANEGIAQVLFFRGEEEPEVSYKDKGGKYQSQVGVTLPRL
jgi:dCTP deaminase